jgi:GntR family transcriptional regulator, rspAB operon transcriptional repressor
MFPISDDQTSKNAIYVELRRSIIMGHHIPNDRLDVEVIAKQYNTSVTPVRDALQMLSQEGLVNIKPRSGYFMASTTLKQLRDLLDLRHIMELAAVERAVERITSEQIEELRSVHAGYTGDDDVSYDRYTEENRHFHYLIAKASGNNELAQFVARLHDRLARFMVLRHAGLTMLNTHKTIVDALEAHDINAAKDALLDDIERSHKSILDKVLQQEEIESINIG